MKLILRFLMWLGQKACEKHNAIVAREALLDAWPEGTRVRFECRCRYDHSGIWRILRYDVDANDYKIEREGDGMTDFAQRKVLRLVS